MAKHWGSKASEMLDAVMQAVDKFTGYRSNVSDRSETTAHPAFHFCENSGQRQFEALTEGEFLFQGEEVCLVD